jgi:hypothetical protein
MRGRRLVPLIVLILTSTGSAAADPALEDVEQRLGPFRLGRQDLTVVLHLKRLPPGAGHQEDTALSDLEIHDGSGNVLHRETFSYSLDAGELADSCAASAQRLAGGAGDGLLLSISCLPSAPGSGDVWELFGLHDGRLVRFGKPFTTDGTFLDLIPTPPRKLGQATLFMPDVMRFRVRSGPLQVTLPVRVDWMQGGLTPGLRCFEQTGHGLRESGCEVPVEAERVPVDAELTFVRLFTDASELSGPARHVVLRKDSRVEILAAKVRTSWDDSREVLCFGIDDRDPWLKVRIDGAEGWIHTQEDFIAIGLPQAG